MVLLLFCYHMSLFYIIIIGPGLAQITEEIPCTHRDHRKVNHLYYKEVAAVVAAIPVKANYPLIRPYRLIIQGTYITY